MILDLIAALIITYGFYRGFSKGLIDTVVDTLSILVGIVVAMKFSPLLIDYIQEVVNIHEGLEFILGFLIIFFTVMLLLRFIGDRMEGLLKAAKVNFLNQLAGGAVLGFVFSFCIGMLFMLLFNLSIINEAYASESTLFGFLTDLTQDSGWIIDGFKNIFSEFWEKFTTTIESVKTNVEGK